jgi:hypothetical protein
LAEYAVSKSRISAEPRDFEYLQRQLERSHHSQDLLVMVRAPGTCLVSPVTVVNPGVAVAFGVVVTFRVVTNGVVALKFVTFSVVVTFEVG